MGGEGEKGGREGRKRGDDKVMGGSSARRITGRGGREGGREGGWTVGQVDNTGRYAKLSILSTKM